MPVVTSELSAIIEVANLLSEYLDDIREELVALREHQKRAADALENIHEAMRDRL